MGIRLTVVVMLAVVLAVAGVFLRAIAAFATSDLARARRVRTDKPNVRITPGAHERSEVVNAIVSTGLVFGVTLAFAPRLFTALPVAPLRVAGEAAAILAIYDLAYYLFHRFVLHGWSVGRRAHAVHHAIRTPYAIDSLYIHPAETAGGVGLFLASAAIVGPIGVWSFGLAFLVYSLLNIWIHSAVDLPGLPLSALVRHHDVHHETMKSGYYASITPIWDVLLGTARRTAEEGRAIAAGDAP